MTVEIDLEEGIIAFAKEFSLVFNDSGILEYIKGQKDRFRKVAVYVFGD